MSILEEIQSILAKGTAWAKEESPSETREHVLVVFIVVMSSTILWILQSLTKSESNSLIEGLGVKLSKVARTAQEIERKTFHISGLGVPLVMQILTSKTFGWTHSEFSKFCWICTACIWIGDTIRVCIPASNKLFPLNILCKLLREKEQKQLSGTCYFSLGCTLAITFFPPAISVLSILWLVLGDMAAALIGVSFGGEAVSLKMGREGKKSVEGSVAMFLTCAVIGWLAIGDVYLSEYVIVVGSLVATIVELYEPFGLNDNITIPVMSCLAIEWALQRLKHKC